MSTPYLNDLSGKNALVTGGTTGIGRATALLFHAAGARVTVTGGHPERVEAARRELPEGVDVILADGRRMADTEHLCRHLSERYATLDVIFLNAGIAQIELLDTATEKHYSEQMDINLR